MTPQTETVPKAKTYLSLHEVAERLGVKFNVVRVWVANGELRAVNVSTTLASQKPRFRVLATDVEAFELRRQLIPPTTPAPRKRRKPAENVIEFYQ